jgi:dienelactone hydrolase
VDWLVKTAGVETVVLVGLCSGADHAILYGPTDPRVVGLALIDPYIPETARFFVEYVTKRIRRAGFAGFRIQRSTLLYKIARRLSRPFVELTELQHISFPGPNARKTVQRSYSAALAARYQILVVCTGGNRTPRQTYREQFLDAFRSVPFGSALRLEFFRDSDHTFSSPVERKRLNGTTLDWIAHAPFRSRAAAEPEPGSTLSHVLARNKEGA